MTYQPSDAYESPYSEPLSGGLGHYEYPVAEVQPDPAVDYLEKYLRKGLAARHAARSVALYAEVG